ncbi:hypothetical protein BU24DRAFT_428660 [Aaosphaeria arxii CBS 175.79]|uniref:Archaemetzincin-2 n=1 Tax=Aaosphaeria arxii CBS 175.79 TaxID=1450172 RepID=A0A6A5X863_9PLEO|nr:uncharacterized protein BU24DRAFT_428660 [Aaosphaeria arxii CBS 175.79]KAF2009138.1 hypothetical protein BU24DRAFT_428660 [Aaosphaeria arxii CBS 175.79]
MSRCCLHEHLQLECSAFAAEAGFVRADASERVAATTISGKLPPKSKRQRIEKDAKDLAHSYPGPLVLPWDDLNLDPDDEPQSFKEWLNMQSRNKPTQERHTIYVVEVPEVTDEVSFMSGWTKPILASDEVTNGKDGPPIEKPEFGKDLEPPVAEPIMDYIEAFYHGITVKRFDQPLRYISAEKKRERNPRRLPKCIKLAYGKRSMEISVRASRDGVFRAQLNLNDMLDAAIDILPDDAYAIILLVDHDIYEDEDDDYCCGRAYGGSRICVVQSARYNPLIDNREKIQHDHLWPMSHCKQYVDELCAEEDVLPIPAKADSRIEWGAIRKAVQAAEKISRPSSAEELQALWFSRVARTAVHELGHCFGMAHCVYYACNMQGTASMKEDGRQPPYFCPVCLTKVSFAVAVELQAGGEHQRLAYIKARNEKLTRFSDYWRDTALFAGFNAWLKDMLEHEV